MQKVRKRSLPLDIELHGYLKTFFIIWIICWIVILLLSGFSWFSFWGSMVLAIPFAVLIYVILLLITGSKEFKGE